MKLPLLFLTCASTVLAVESPIPTMYPPERYEALIARSPFALATPVAAPVAVADKSYAEGWYVSGLAQFEGKDFVTVKSRDLSVQFSLFGTEANENGVALQKVDWSPAIGRSTVTIVKDGQAAKLEFNQAETASAPAGGQPSAMQPPGVNRPPMPINPGAPRPQVMNASTLPQPTVPRPMQQPNLIPRPGGGFSQPTPDPRRRIRVINNTPVK